MVAVEGTTHIVRYLNAAFSRLVAKEARELVGRPFADAVPEGEENRCLSLFDRVYRTGTPEMLDEQEHRHTTPAVYWSYSVWAILGVEERPVGVIIQVTDATEVALFRRQVGEEDRIRALQSGFQIHVPKPISPSELLAVVANLAGRTTTG